jgi:hypothetical protein
LTRPRNSSADILFQLGSAYLDTHDDAQASARFERVVSSGAQRAGDPISFVRSLYFLGQISERKGDRAKAAESAASCSTGATGTWIAITWPTHAKGRDRRERQERQEGSFCLF